MQTGKHVKCDWCGRDWNVSTQKGTTGGYTCQGCAGKRGENKDGMGAQEPER